LRVNLQAPAIDAAGHALAICHTLLAQPIHDLQAPHSVVAIHHYHRFIGEAFNMLELRGHGPHGDKLCTFEPCLLELERLPDIDQRRRFARCHTARDFARSDFKRQLCIHSLILMEEGSLTHPSRL